MQQTKLESLIESIFNILIGYWVAIFSQLIIFPLFDINIPFSTNLTIGAWFTLVSLLRSYLIRRWFNAGLHKLALTTAKTFLRL
jgi:hypothetical protein